jgi:hypothetical protein
MRVSKCGLQYSDLQRAETWFANKECKTEMIAFHTHEVCGMNIDQPAWILVIRGGVSVIADYEQLLQEQLSLEPDKKALMRGRVVNKHARHGESDRKPDYARGMGTIVAFHNVPQTNRIRETLHTILGETTRDLQCVEYYFIY